MNRTPRQTESGAREQEADTHRSDALRQSLPENILRRMLNISRIPGIVNDTAAEFCIHCLREN